MSLSNDIRYVMIFIPLDDKTLSSLKETFQHVYYHPEFWDVFSWFHHDLEGCQRAFDAVDEEEWKNVQMMVVGFLIPQLKNRQQQVPHLKWIQLRAVGAEVIFRHEMLKNEPPDTDLKVVNICGIPSSAIAQHVFMLIMAVYRKLDQYILLQAQKVWKRPPDNFNIPDITTLTYGILGYGSIGREIARLARGWGVRNILACNTSGQRTHNTSFCPDGTGDPEGMIPTKWYSSQDPDSFKTFLSESDVLIVSVPSCPSTHKILDSETISYLSPTTILINVARGSLIDQEALVEALNSGRLGGAGLDVLESEPPGEQCGNIWTAKNCIVTPHVSYLAGKFWERVVDLIKLNKQRLAEGEDMFNVVPWPKRDIQ